MCTSLSAATFVPNKNKDTTFKAIFRIWIAVYGSPDKILVNNRGELANTATESTWSNGIVERNNQTLANMMNKISLF